MDTQSLQGSWHYPSSILAGAGRAEDLADACESLGIQAPLLVTDPGLARLSILESAVTNCRRAGLKIAVFDQISANPRGPQIVAGVDAFRAGTHDGVIAFGGGSALDAGKAVALMVGQTGVLWDYEDVGDNWRRVDEAHMVPIVAVPTTAGTGSEVGRASVITDESRQCKRIIFHPDMQPQRVILDPELTVGLSPSLTAATGMDALSHNLEALCAPGYHPMADGIAMEGIRLVKDYLPRAVADGTDLEARMQMLTASSMGATAFQKGLGAMHALAHPLGALYDAHHGLLNAVLMPYVLQANRSAVAIPASRLARYIGLGRADCDGLLAWVLALRKELGIPHSLSQLGIDGGEAERVGRMAVEDAAAAGNPIQFTVRQYGALFLAAVRGELSQ